MYYSHYEKIYCGDDISNIVDVSTLRHYINIYGVTDKLMSYLGFDNDVLEKVYKVCYGFMDIKDIIEDPLKCIESCIVSRNKKEEALRKNAMLVMDLVDKRENICGIGTRKVKLMLNKEIKGGDVIAKMYRLALEIEDKNIQAKDKKNYMYQDKIYADKKTLIDELINVCRENEIIYGYHKSDVSDTSHVIFFELPEMEQISFHCTFDSLEGIPEYNKEWDGKVNSTLGKVETSITKLYGKQIEEYKNKDKEKPKTKKKS